MNNQIEFLGKAGIIVADWDIRNEYPYKTFTTDYNTWISYISRKPVPVGTPITDINYWKPVLKPSDTDMRTWLQDIDNKINSFLESIGGTAISTQFGNSDLVGISQRVITEAINKIWDKLDEMTGENHRAIRMAITPDFFTGDSCNITMTATATELVGIFEHIEFLINGQPFEGNSADVVNSFSCSTIITEECDITCNATILGRVYTVSQHVYKSDVLYFGTGSTYNDVLNQQHAIRVEDFNGDYNVEFDNGDYLFVIIPVEYSGAFVRADLNGMEIPMEQSTITVGDKSYVVNKSINSYTAGTYNIDINS